MICCYYYIFASTGNNLLPNYELLILVPYFHHIQFDHHHSPYTSQILKMINVRAGVPLLRGQAEGVGAVQPGEEKGPG